MVSKLNRKSISPGCCTGSKAPQDTGGSNICGTLEVQALACTNVTKAFAEKCSISIGFRFHSLIHSCSILYWLKLQMRANGSVKCPIVHVVFTYAAHIKPRAAYFLILDSSSSMAMPGLCQRFMLILLSGTVPDNSLVPAPHLRRPANEMHESPTPVPDTQQ